MSWRDAIPVHDEPETSKEEHREHVQVLSDDEMRWNVMKSEIESVSGVRHTMTNEVHGVGWCSDTEEIMGMWILAYSVSLCGR